MNDLILYNTHNIGPSVIVINLMLNPVSNIKIL